MLGLDLVRSVGQGPPAAPEIPDDVAEFLAQRATARGAKQWAESDRLRDVIAARGFTVVDTANGQELCS